MRTPPPVLPDPGSEASGYKPTWLDRHGADGGLRLRAIGYGLMVFGTVVGVALLLLAQGGHVGWFSILMLFVVAAALGTLVIAAGSAFAHGSGVVARSFTMPSGNSTPYEEQFSYQEAMVARGDLQGALVSYEAIIAERPTAVAPRLRAAEHYAERGLNLPRAVELFREARSIEGVTIRDEIYATSRLIDLYDGPLNDPGRALVEMRRMIDRYPDSRIAMHTRTALPAMKARLHNAPGANGA